MSQMFRLARCATVIAAACGGSDGNEGEDPETCGNGVCDQPGDEDCQGDCAPETCGNGSCDTGETCANCGEDCGCPSGQTCSGDTCVVDTTPRCGDGVCTGPTARIPEDCASCAEDCGCATDQRCWSWDEELDPLHALPPNAAEYRMGNICGTDNPLFDVIPGRWRWIELRGSPPIDAGPYNFGVDIIATGCYIPGHETGDACVYGFTGFSSAVLDGARLFLHDPDGGEREGEVLTGGTRMEYDDYRRDNPEETREHSVWANKEK